MRWSNLLGQNKKQNEQAKGKNHHWISSQLRAYHVEVTNQPTNWPLDCICFPVDHPHQLKNSAAAASSAYDDGKRLMLMMPNISHLAVQSKLLAT